MALVTYTDPVILDSTGQDIVTQLTRLANTQTYTAGDGININNNVVSTKVASASQLGAIKVGDGLSIDGSTSELSVVVDSALSATSENPVQNKVITNAISAISSMSFEVVQELPTTDIRTDVIYLVPKSTSQTNNTYDEYICLDATTTPATWEKIGDTEIDLTNYVQKSSTAGLIKNDGTINTTIEGAVSSNTSAISGIKDGQSIDSFGDVETALSTKYDTGDTAETALDNDDYVPFYDTSASAKRKTLWSNIKSVLKSYFDLFYCPNNLVPSSATTQNKLATINDTNRVTWVANAYLGASNLFDINSPRTDRTGVTSSVTSSATSNSLRVSNSTADSYKYTSYTLTSLPKNTDLQVMFGATVTSGKGELRISGSSDGMTWGSIADSEGIYDTTTNKVVQFNTASYTMIKFDWYCAVDSSVAGDVTYTDIMIAHKGSNMGYVPPVMTNKELTDEIAGKANTSDVPTKDNVIANTKLIKDTVGWSGKNIADDSKSEIGIAWNGGANSARARLIIPVKPNSSYIFSVSGTNNLDGIFYGRSASIPCAEIYAIQTNPYTINTGANDNYLTLGFNKDNITLNDIQLLKLMLRDANILDDTYEPYFGSTAFPRSEQAVLGAKNRLPVNLSVMKNVLGGWTWSGNSATKDGITLTFTVDGDEVTEIDIDGTSTAQNDIHFWYEGNGASFYNTIKGQSLILSGLPSNVSDKLKLNFWCADTGNKDDEGSGVTIDFPSPVPASWNIKIRVYSGKTLSHVKVYPMLRLATDPDPSYAPYAMTNRELTDAVATIPTVSVSHTGTASSTGVRKQQITVNNVNYDVDGSAYMEQEVILSTSAATTVTFTNAIIADGKMLTFSSSIWDLVPDNMVTTTGVCTVTLPKWTSADTIGCRLYVR